MYVYIYSCSVAKLYQTLCDPKDYSTAGFPVLCYLPEFAQTHVHCVIDATQSSHPLMLPSPSAFDIYIYTYIHIYMYMHEYAYNIDLFIYILFSLS